LTNCFKIVLRNTAKHPPKATAKKHLHSIFVTKSSLSHPYELRYRPSQPVWFHPSRPFVC